MENLLENKSEQCEEIVNEMLDDFKNSRFWYTVYCQLYLMSEDRQVRNFMEVQFKEVLCAE